MAIDPRLLTVASLRQKQQTNAARGVAAKGAAKKSSAYKAVLQRATRAYGAAYANKVYGSQYKAALAAEQRARGSYGQIRGQLGDFTKQYNRLGVLGKANPSVDNILNGILPFDPQAASDRLGAQQGLNQSLLRIKQGKDQLAEDYSKGVRDLETDQPDRYRALLSNFASRGMGFSSSYADALGKETADFTKARSSLDTANQRGQSAAALDESGANSLFNSQIAAILANSTARLADNAGNLGMAGNTDLPLMLEIARRRLASQGAAVT